MMDIALKIFLDGFMAAVAALGFGAVSQPSRRSLPYICLLAALGHITRFVLMTYVGVSIVTASLAGAVMIGMISLWAGRRCHTPLSCLFIPALLPMVPGMYAYRAVFALIMFIQTDGSANQPEYLHLFMSNLFTSIMVVSVLAAGASLPKFLFRRKAYTMTRHCN